MIIGLTGGIATGKSTVAAMLRELGVCHIDADRIGHRMLAQDSPVFSRVVEQFGPEILDPDGAIDRKRLGDLVFSGEEAKKQLEKIVHPAIMEEIDRQLIQCPAGLPVVLDAPLLIEAGLHSMVDVIWVTHCREETQVSRLRERGLTRQEAVARIRSQMPAREKLALATERIDTEKTLNETRKQIARLYREITGQVPPQEK